VEKPLIKRTLRPCVGNEVDAVMGIEYAVWRDGGRICVEYDIHGMLSHLVIPEQCSGATDKRRDDLWRHTCFELFVKEADEKKKGYLECNLLHQGIGMSIALVPIGRKWRMQISSRVLRLRRLQ
jgi:hypothetical protein